MTEAELLEIINLHAANAITSLSVYITLLFGYMTAAYVAGSKLSSLQVTIISLVYVFSAIAWGLVNITHAHSLETLVAAHTNFVPSPFFLLPWSLLSGTAWFSCLIASLYFMYDIRSNSVKN